MTVMQQTTINGFIVTTTKLGDFFETSVIKDISPLQEIYPSGAFYATRVTDNMSAAQQAHDNAVSSMSEYGKK